MPATIKKVKGGYQVSTPNGIKSKHTTKAKAQAQAKLLRGVEHGWVPTGKKKRPSRGVVYGRKPMAGVVQRKRRSTRKVRR